MQKSIPKKQQKKTSQKKVQNLSFQKNKIEKKIYQNSPSLIVKKNLHSTVNKAFNRQRTTPSLIQTPSILLKNITPCKPFTTQYLPMSTTPSEPAGQNSPDSSPELRSKIKVYTKTGDMGVTSLYNMERMSKTSCYFNALGDTDEVNSTIGLAREYFINIPAVVKFRDENGTPTELNDTFASFNLDTSTTQQNKPNDIIDVDLQLQIIQSRLLDVGSWYVFFPKKIKKMITF